MTSIDKNIIKTIFNQNIEREKAKRQTELEKFIAYSNKKLSQQLSIQR